MAAGRVVHVVVPRRVNGALGQGGGGDVMLAVQPREMVRVLAPGHPEDGVPGPQVGSGCTARRVQHGVQGLRHRREHCQEHTGHPPPEEEQTEGGQMGHGDPLVGGRAHRFRRRHWQQFERHQSFPRTCPRTTSRVWTDEPMPVVPAPCDAPAAWSSLQALPPPRPSSGRSTTQHQPPCIIPSAPDLVQQRMVAIEQMPLSKTPEGALVPGILAVEPLDRPPSRGCLPCPGACPWRTRRLTTS